MNLTVQRMTPSRATELLATRGPDARALSTQRVADLARVMAAGLWVPPSSPIIIGTDGRLHDGAHRLQAVVNAGVTIEMLVATDVSPSELRPRELYKRGV